jgi:enamine deaminase RidA (YjgF/YER057c/UK114 family)
VSLPDGPVLGRVTGYSPYEEPIGFSRAVIVAADRPRVLVAGTTSVVDGVVTHPGDAYGQLRQALETAGRALREAGSGLEYVVRTRMYVTGPEHCDGAGRAHHDVFADVRPVATMLIVSGFIHPDMVAEIEVEAVVP